MSKLNHLYQTRTWKQLRAAHLRQNPFCVHCAEEGYTAVPGNTVDHKVPHRGDMALFTDPSNLQTLCAPHHSRAKQLEERYGYAPGADEHGNPLDPRHPWGRGESKSVNDVPSTTGSVPPRA